MVIIIIIIIIIILITVTILELVCWEVTQHSPRCVTSQKTAARETNDEDDDYFFGQYDHCLNFLKTR